VADHIIDIGPEGGQGGGRIVAQGSPQEIVKNGKGYTAEYLKDIIVVGK
jgi:excinuclease ABC subunit A